MYVGGLTTFGVGMLLLGVFPTKNLSLILSISGGIIYATLFTFPFLLVARYHEKGSVRKNFLDDIKKTNLLIKNKKLVQSTKRSGSAIES